MTDPKPRYVGDFLFVDIQTTVYSYTFLLSNIKASEIGFTESGINR
jgi:hypothetical protein